MLLALSGVVDLSFIISVAALLLSGGAVYYTKRQSDASDRVAGIEADRRADEITAKGERSAIKAQAELAEKQADLRVARIPGNGVDRIRITNHGPAIAQGVVVALGPVAEVPGQLPQFLEPASACREYLAAGSSMDVPYSAPAECAIRFKVAIHWKDGSGTRDAQEEVLDIG